MRACGGRAGRIFSSKAKAGGGARAQGGGGDAAMDAAKHVIGRAAAAAAGQANGSRGRERGYRALWVGMIILYLLLYARTRQVRVSVNTTRRARPPASRPILSRPFLSCPAPSRPVRPSVRPYECAHRERALRFASCTPRDNLARTAWEGCVATGRWTGERERESVCVCGCGWVHVSCRKWCDR